MHNVWDSTGVVLLAPESRGSDWDYAMTGTFGPDIAFINAAMEAVFARYNVQGSSLGMQGFSDGATYALTLGTPCTNSSLLHAYSAFSKSCMYVQQQKAHTCLSSELAIETSSLHC